MAAFTEYLDTSFDRAFDELRNQKLLSWYPWVGKEYARDTARIMFILESAYQNENNKETIQSPDFTRQTIHEVFFKGARYSHTLNNIGSFVGALLGKQTVWGNLVYHNIVQRAMDYRGNNKEQPNDADYGKGCILLKEILTVLKPDLCICMGVKLNPHIREGKTFSSYLTREKTEPGKINGVWLLDALRLDLNGHKTRMLFTAHPANPTGFTAPEWAKYVHRYAPEEIKRFKEGLK